MRIAVCMKETESSPADRAALEVGMGIRERLAGVRLEAFSVCEEPRVESLFFARARGADAVHRIVPSRRWRGHCATALALAARLRVGGRFDLVLCGERSAEPTARIGPLLAELLELPAVTAVCGVRERRRDGLVVEHRLAGDEPQPATVSLPALLTTTEDAAPRAYVSPRRMARARRQSIVAWELEWNGELPSVPRRVEERGLHRFQMMN